MFDRFDICEAYYWFATYYHGGQFSKEYVIFGRLEKIGYKPGCMASSENMSEGAREIYDNLVRKAGFVPESN